MNHLRLFAAGVSLSIAACAGEAPRQPPPLIPQPEPTPSATASVDPLAERPIPAAGQVFVPPAVSERTHASGVRVWQLSRTTLPLVSLSFVWTTGSAADPSNRPGLANMTAHMLMEGAGKRDSGAFAQAVEALGAHISVTAYTDYTTVSVTVLKDKLDAAMELVADAVIRPRFLAPDFARAKGILLDDLRSARKDPKAIADAASLALHYGEGPYGHPRIGTVDGVSKVTLAETKAFHTKAYRSLPPTLVACGDVSNADVDALLVKHFGDLVKRGPAAAPKLPGPTPLPPPTHKADQVIFVDKADAPQSVIMFVAPGLTAAAPESMYASRANTPLGGSFTSRLNQDLREERGLTYGASSRMSFSKNPGMFVASASVVVDRTGEALKAMMADINAYTQTGPSDEEAAKSKSLARNDLVEVFESVSQASARLSRNAGVGLPFDYEVKAAERKDAASKDDLTRLAKTLMDPKKGFILVVGPKSVLPQLKESGFPDVIAYTP